LSLVSLPPPTPEERFAAVVDEFAHRPGVTPPTDAPGTEGKFGAAALKVNNRIFAMLVRGRLVLKLPRLRVDALVASGEGDHFEAGKGRAMAEWVALAATSQLAWLSLADEAMEFVASKR
jgi:hypothetical protein